MTFRVTCKNCSSKLNAKDELLGQTRKCPKCAQPLLLQPDIAPPESVPLGRTTGNTEIVQNNEIPLEHGPLIAKLDYLNKYYILGLDRLLASWKGNGQGWLFNVGNGFLPVKRNLQAIPDQGTFALIELVVKETPEGHRLRGMNIFRISSRGALTVLIRGEDEILARIDSRGSLSKIQKACLSAHIRAHFMFDFLSGAPKIMDFLSNDDIISTQIAEE